MSEPSDLQRSAPLAEQAADSGMAQALRAERVAQWKQAADEWLFVQPLGTLFVLDDVVAAIGLPDHGVAKNNVVGAWTSAQARLGHTRWTGRFKKSERVIGHGNLQRVWEVV